MPILSVVIPRLKTIQLRWSFSGAFEFHWNKFANHSTETKKMWHDLADEVELKLKVEAELESRVNQKVYDNLTRILKKLGEANPDLKIDTNEFCATILSER